MNEFSFSCNTKCQLVSSFVCAIPETRIMRRRRNDKRSLVSLFYFSPAHNTKMYVVKCAAKLSQKLNEWEASILYNFCCYSWSFFDLFITFNRTWKGKVCLVTVLFWWNVRGKKKKKRKIHKIIIEKKNGFNVLRLSAILHFFSSVISCYFLRSIINNPINVTANQ